MLGVNICLYFFHRHFLAPSSCDLQAQLDEYCSQMSTEGQGDFLCSTAVSGMVARKSLNANGKQLKWRCYGEMMSTNDENACVDSFGVLTNEECSDPDATNGVFCTRDAQLTAIINDHIALLDSGSLDCNTVDRCEGPQPWLEIRFHDFFSIF